MQKTILIVDDNKTVRAMVSKYLLEINPDLEIEEASTAIDALQKMNRKSYTCVFLDFVLKGGLTGMDVLKKLYNEETDLPPMPIIMMTAHGTEEILTEAMRWGAQDYLIKSIVNPVTLNIAMIKATQIFDLKQSRHDASKQLEHIQKTEVFGQLSSGIAHDFNNLLTILIGQAELLNQTLRDDKRHIKQRVTDGTKAIEKMKRSLSRGAELARRLMRFARQQQVYLESCNPAEIIGQFHDVLQCTLGDDVTIVIQDDMETPPRIKTQIGKLEHALVNMALNARDAMPDGGDLILAQNICDLPDHLRGSSLVNAGPYYHLSISDTGTGMDKETSKQVFEPFFTTKDSGKGTGLGLAMVQEFVSECNGYITLESEKGTGTTFDLYFPICKSGETLQRENDEQKQSTLSKPAINQDKTILVVEDEADIRNMICGMLGTSGYKIIEASNSCDAIAILIDQSHEIDMLFTDISMPGEMNGVQLAGRAQVLKPGLKLLFTTGYDDSALQDMNLARKYNVLTKPYEPNDLFEAVDRALNS